MGLDVAVNRCDDGFCGVRFVMGMGKRGWF